MRNFIRGALLVGAALTGLASVSPARATFILSPTQGNNQGTDNVIFNACIGASQVAGSPFQQGCLSAQPTTLVDFTSIQKLQVNGGQARIEAYGNTQRNPVGFDNINIFFDAANTGFNKLLFNIDALANGTANFTVRGVDQLGNPELPTNFSFAINGNGQNFFTLTTLDGEIATSFSIVSTVQLLDIGDLSQVRIGAETVPTVNATEPASIAVLGVSLVSAGLFARKRKGGIKRLASAPLV